MDGNQMEETARDSGQPHLPLVRLEYSIHSCSSYSGQYGPENILVDNPTDQRSRWSGGNGYTTALAAGTGGSGSAANTSGNNGSASGLQLQSTAQGSSAPASASASTLFTGSSHNIGSSTPTSQAGGPPSGPQAAASVRERQWIVLKLARRAIVRTITFGKYSRSHPCNVRELKVYAGLSPDVGSMALVHWGGLKNDSVPETFALACRAKQAGIPVPADYVCIEPISAHSSNYNVSIWHVALAGHDQEDFVEEVYRRFTSYRESRVNKLILKHLRQRGHTAAFQSLLRSVRTGDPGFSLEHPVISQLHAYLVQKGDFSASESLMASLVYPTAVSDDGAQSSSGDDDGKGSAEDLLEAYCTDKNPKVQWVRLDTMPGVSAWDGQMPCARGGHQLVLVRPPRPTGREGPSSDRVPDVRASYSAEGNNEENIDAEMDLRSNASHSDLELPSAKEPGNEQDDDGACLYLYGGWDGKNELSDIWSFSLYHGRWQLISANTNDPADDGLVPARPGARSCHQMVVDEETGDIYTFGRFVDVNSMQEGRPDEMPSASGSSTGTTSASAPTVSISNGGSLTEPAPSNQRVSPSVSPRTVAAQLQSPVPQLEAQIRAPAPLSAISSSSASLEPPTAQMNLNSARPSSRGTAEAVASPKPDFWVFHTYGEKAGQWERLSSDTQSEGGPPLIFDHQMVIDVDARELYVFGGKYYTSSGQSQYSGLYSYSLRSRKWRLLSADAEPSGVTYPTSARIPSRIGHSMLFDPKHKRLLVLAGQRVDVFLSDVWAYDIQKGVWECLERDSSLAGGPEGGFTQRATMDVARREFVLLSGLMRDRSPPHLPNVKNAIWIRSLESGQWRKVDSVQVDQGSHSSEATRMDLDQEEPKPRFAHQFVYDPVSDEHYLFGGNPADATVSSRLGDFWRLKLMRVTKDEILGRAKFLIRRCRFWEMCANGDSMEALLYLQTALASVTSPSDQGDFLACMSYLLAARSSALQRGGPANGGLSGDASECPPPHQHEDDVQDDDQSAGSDLASWRQRTEVFQELLAFFPPSQREPQDDLLDTSVALEEML